jgi:hypothetical protein
VDIVGAGSLSVIGGNATTGGGGGGGRVYLDATGDYNFTGKYVLKGGNSNKSEAGGAGTTRMDADPHTNSSAIKCKFTVVILILVESPTSNSLTVTFVCPGRSMMVSDIESPLIPVLSDKSL